MQRDMKETVAYARTPEMDTVLSKVRETILGKAMAVSDDEQLVVAVLFGWIREGFNLPQSRAWYQLGSLRRMLNELGGNNRQRDHAYEELEKANAGLTSRMREAYALVQAMTPVPMPYDGTQARKEKLLALLNTTEGKRVR